MPESFVQEMKRYLDIGPPEADLLRQIGPRMEKHFPELAERFYSQIPHHPAAFRVLSGGDQQIARLKQTLQVWARGLFSGVYDEAYAEERYLIGYRHVRIGLEQRYVISAMGIVRSFLIDCLSDELPGIEERRVYGRALSRILDLDLNLMCESYMQATMENLRQINAQLEAANQELSQASRTKDTFLSNVSHELRTPLNSILGFAKMILDGLCSSPEEERELLRDVFASAKHLLALVNDILDIRRIEEGKMSLRIENVDLRALLDSTLPLIAVQAAEKQLALIDETAAGALPVVWADEMRLRQILLNLLNNAIKFTPAGSVTIRVVSSPTDDSPPQARVEIEDTGIGIPPEKRETAFDEFVQLNELAALKARGAGLGLAISRRLVELMGGRIGLDSGTDGRGTRAWFTVPLAATGGGKQVEIRTAQNRIEES